MGVRAKISEATIVLPLKVTLSQERIANRNVVNKNREKKINLPNLELGKCLLLLVLPHVSCLTLGKPPAEKSATIVTAGISPYGNKLGAECTGYNISMIRY